MEYCGKKINSVLLKLFSENKNLYHLGEDILDPYGGAFKITKGLSTKFPERIITTPISEAAITGFAIGMAIKGMIPIIEIMFGDFVTLTFDQVLNHLSKFYYMYDKKIQPKVIMRVPMGGYRGYGPTHSQSLEKYLVGIPGIQIVAISDMHDLEKLYRHSILVEKKPVIIIENKSLYSSLYLHNSNMVVDDFSVEFTKEPFPSAILSLDNSREFDLTIVTYGGLAKDVREIIKGRFINFEDKIQLVVISNLNNLDTELLSKYLNKSKNVLFIEEGTQAFGLSTEYSFRIKKFFEGGIHRLCAKDYIIPNSKHLELEVLPSKESINEKIDEIIGKKK